MDGVQLPQGYSHFEEAVYFLPFSGGGLIHLSFLINTTEEDKMLISY